jgi:RNA polymerase sigma-70 factor, ECF subfamily
MSQAATPDHELLAQLPGGNEEAFLELHRRLQAPIFRFALAMSGSRTIAEDVVQEAFLMLLQKAGRFDPGKGTVRAYLLGIARHCVLHRLKDDRAYVSLSRDNGDDQSSRVEEVSGSDPLADCVREQAVHRVREAVLALPLHYREVLIWCDLEEKSYDETSRIVGCSPGTVRSRLHRARAFLSEKLRSAEGFDHVKAKSQRCTA